MNEQCTDRTETAGQQVTCVKAAGHEGNHLAYKDGGYEVIWDSVVLAPPARGGRS